MALESISFFTRENCHRTGTYDTPAYAYSVYASGSYAYVADQASGLQIIYALTPP
jgi:hypothetical protein